MKVKGRGDFCLVEKLKILKKRHTWWNQTVFGWVNLIINNAIENMAFLDNEFVNFAGNVPEEVVKRRANAAEVFWDNLNKKEGLLRLKSRQTWLAEGDCNSRFFHKSLRSRKGSKSLCSIDSRRGGLEEVKDIREFIQDHFEGFFKELVYGRRAFSSKDSFWWRDVLNNYVKDVPSEEGFTGCIQSFVKKGDSILFWFGIWLADETLCF